MPDSNGEIIERDVTELFSSFENEQRQELSSTRSFIRSNEKRKEKERNRNRKSKSSFHNLFHHQKNFRLVSRKKTRN